MKSFSEIAEVKVTRDDLPSIYCDMDMVLCDFMKSADNVVGGSFVQADKVTDGIRLVILKTSGQT